VSKCDVRGVGLALASLLFLSAPACAARNAAAARAVALAAAEALQLQGCYACLREARDAFAQLATGPDRQAVLVRLFETELLLTLREKELGMDWSAAQVRAEAVAAGLPPVIEAARYLAVVDAVPPESAGVSQAEEAEYRRSRASVVPRIDGELAWLESGPLLAPVRQYLSLALDCMHWYRPSRLAQAGPDQVRRTAPPGAPPLVVFRAAICGDIQRDELEQVHDKVPRFAEASYYLARLEMAESQRTGGPRGRLDDAYANLPTSPAVTYLYGSFWQLVGDCREALRFYDETVALRGGHENALLGRVVCLTFLRRPDEAMAEATRMIDRQTVNAHEAYYWRAWNRHALGRLPDAREDIERAKKMAVTGAIYTLAGIIEHDQDDLEPATRDLRTATRIRGGAGNCTAYWYLGLVGIKREEWLGAAAHFRDAMRCYERGALDSEAALLVMETKEGLDPEFRASQIEKFRLAVADDRSQQYAAAFNAANHYARGGEVESARTLLEIAAKDPALASRVAELRKIIGGG
jgi:tetratricopeptide (TPR) repeat protein